MSPTPTSTRDLHRRGDEGYGMFAETGASVAMRLEGVATPVPFPWVIGGGDATDP